MLSNINHVPEQPFGVLKRIKLVIMQHSELSIKVVEKAEFGVEEYNTCAIRKTKFELSVFLESIKPYIKRNTIEMSKAQINYLFNSGLKEQTSCLIKRWSDDPLYEDVVSDMKNTFSASFGDEYKKDAYACDGVRSDLVKTPETEICEDLKCSKYQKIKMIASGSLSPSDVFSYNTCLQKKV